MARRPPSENGRHSGKEKTSCAGWTGGRRRRRHPGPMTEVRRGQAEVRLTKAGTDFRWGLEMGIRWSWESMALRATASTVSSPP